MKTSKVVLWTVAACLCLASQFAGCGSESGADAGAAGGDDGGGEDTGGGAADSGGGGECPSIAGAWRITVHCDANYVDKTFDITQTGCAFSGVNPVNGSTFTGTIGADGTVTLDGGACTGTLDGDSWHWTCGDCVQELVRS